jgi:two-component system, chemotaxis family, CheB/CheR fusion protein
LRDLLENIIPRNSQFNNYEVRHNFPEIGEKTMLLNGRRIFQKINRQQLILLAIEDISEHKIDTGYTRTNGAIVSQPHQ